MYKAEIKIEYYSFLLLIGEKKTFVIYCANVHDFVK